jgi:hypothetical protein
MQSLYLLHHHPYNRMFRNYLTIAQCNILKNNIYSSINDQVLRAAIMNLVTNKTSN